MSLGRILGFPTVPEWSADRVTVPTELRHRLIMHASSRLLTPAAFSHHCKPRCTHDARWCMHTLPRSREATRARNDCQYERIDGALRRTDLQERASSTVILIGQAQKGLFDSVGTMSLHFGCCQSAAGQPLEPPRTVLVRRHVLHRAQCSVGLSAHGRRHSAATYKTEDLQTRKPGGPVIESTHVGCGQRLSLSSQRRHKVGSGSPLVARSGADPR